MRYLGLTALLLGTGLLTSGARADVVTDWNEVAVDVGRRLALGSNRATRVLAITHLAIYDAVESVTREYQPYSRYVTPRSREVSIEAAVAQAAHDALLWLNPTESARLDAELERSLDAIEASTIAKQNGIELGRAIASEIVYSRLADGSSDVETYDLTIPPDPSAAGGASAGGSAGGSSSGGSAGTAGLSAGGVTNGDGGSGGASGDVGDSSSAANGGATGGGSAGQGPVNPIPGAGLWRPTPRAPANGVEPVGASAVEPQWRGVTPFGIASPNVFRALAKAPPTLTSEAYTDAYDEVKALGSFSNSTRTAEQTDIANFWRQETQVPFNAIARSVALQKGLTLEQNARLFALLNVALADVRIAVWDIKYLRGFWRPITAVRLGDRDGNAATSGDPTWRPLFETPAHPSYVSGHSATGAAAAAVLATVFGDDTSFSVASDTLLGKVRSFEKFSAAARENAESRVYGGIHFRFDNEEGLVLGKAVGEYVASQLLRPTSVVSEGGAGAAAGSSGAEAAGAFGVAGEGGVGGSAGGAESGLGGVTAQGGATVGRGGSSSGGLTSTAGQPGDAGAGGAGSHSVPGDDDGCSCSVPGQPTTSRAPWALALAGLITWRRRRDHGTRR